MLLGTGEKEALWFAIAASGSESSKASSFFKLSYSLPLKLPFGYFIFLSTVRIKAVIDELSFLVEIHGLMSLSQRMLGPPTMAGCVYRHWVITS